MNVESNNRPIGSMGVLDGTQLDNGMSENRANASLIAAAPKMFEALKKINKLAQCSDDRFSEYSDMINDYSKEAIESATGQLIEELL
jgi:hypothetical protein